MALETNLLFDESDAAICTPLLERRYMAHLLPVVLRELDDHKLALLEVKRGEVPRPEVEHRMDILADEAFTAALTSPLPAEPSTMAVEILPFRVRRRSASP
ncbi:hypothetical protein [Streptomyces mesophilus]|uniref:hypothetical protein n=1 Tax=Streptomyces mesophilus TaxID=1775132 RepID=UPI00331CA0B9